MIIDQLEDCIRLAHLYDWEDVQSSPVRKLILSALQTNRVSLQKSRWELYSRLAGLFPESMRGHYYVRSHGYPYVDKLEHTNRTLNSTIKATKASDVFLVGNFSLPETRVEIIEVLVEFYYWISRDLHKKIPDQEQMILIQVPVVAKKRIEKRSSKSLEPGPPAPHQYSLL